MKCFGWFILFMVYLNYRSNNSQDVGLLEALGSGILLVFFIFCFFMNAKFGDD